MTHAEFLERQALPYWNRGERIPIDLFYQMLGIGLDVDKLERQHMKEPA